MASQECNGACKSGKDCDHCEASECPGKQCVCQGCNGDCHCAKEVPEEEAK
ncbi:MAG TPA: hypothetical protein P5080_02540 [Candidatus Paceibacterota bacterium]|nr:hypothetical protein [Candidatus Pacearchaeota archaeon]HRZ50847.1 hypothetical protein [Candidatus Paceibacterota bacterium]HSA36568.1 hypothetical protein [Candidatus Paceibacterota bacterium]